MSKKNVVVCDYCGKVIDQVRESLILDKVGSYTLVSINHPIDLTYEFIEHGKDTVRHSCRVDGLDACNTIHLSLAIKYIGEGLKEDIERKTMAEADIPCEIRWTDMKGE